MSEKKTKIMLVEDDVKLAEMTKEYLEKNLFDVSVEHRGDLAVERILKEKPDFVILDYMLPGKDGKSICRELRPQFHNPIIIVTAHDDEVDEIVTLEIGVDDYIVKPITPRNLLARITNLINRYERIAAEASVDQSVAKPDSHGSLQIDVQKRIAIVDGRDVNLTSCEFDLLSYFFANQGIILTREEIYRQMRGIEWDGADRSIDLRVSRLRNKIDDNGKSPRFIKSVRGTGYMLVSQD
ncbi:MAG: response regulator transcription factor [Proteobacteria bacterium]|nr:response regulator transcription factor [Pseudomonadota bacterium]MBQ9243029.1 response regulator transcription factor [Pseudomonadota bacterium]